MGETRHYFLDNGERQDIISEQTEFVHTSVVSGSIPKHIFYLVLVLTQNHTREGGIYMYALAEST